MKLLAPDLAVRVLEVTQIHDFDQFTHPELKHLKLQDAVHKTPVEDQVLAIIKQHTPSISKDLYVSTERALFIIRTAGKPRIFIIIDGDLSPEQIERISGFCRIALNHLQLLDQNERDPLTGLYNRKTFEDRIYKVFESSSDDTQCSSTYLCLLDIDHFKRINDNFGHLYGDEVLLLVSNLMNQNFKCSDLLFRYGGEEFIAVLQCPSDQYAFRAMERFRTLIAEFRFPRIGHITISSGFTRLCHEEILSTAIDKADAALYYSKEHGRNQVNFYEQLVADKKLPMIESQETSIELF